MLQDYSKSFTMGSNKKFINLTLPCISYCKYRDIKKKKIAL